MRPDYRKCLWIAAVAVSGAAGLSMVQGFAEEASPKELGASPLPLEPETAPPPPLPGEPLKPSPDHTVAPEGAAPPATPAPSLENPPAPAPSETPTPEPTPPSVIEASPTPPPRPAPEAQVEASASAAAASRAARGRYPRYQLSRPAWGISITGALKALGGQNLIAAQADNPTRALEIQAEYQFPFLQKWGVFCLGPTVAVYPITPNNSVTGSLFSLWGAGGQFRYQARYFREQLIVPLVGYEAQYFSYQFLNGPSGHLTAKGFTFGGMLLLNWFEPSSAAESYINEGISRSYLVAELKNLIGSDSNISFSGQSVFFGLRLEF